MRRKIPMFLISFFLLFFLWEAGRAYAEPAQDEAEKRDKIRYAVKGGILSIYDIPFETYIRLEMWDELGFIFEANNKNMIKYDLPGLYYSRPHIVDNMVWVFENAAPGGKGGIYIFNADTLNFIRKLENKEYSKYEGGVRKIYKHTVISGGSDEDVDKAVIWDTRTDDVDIIKLGAGHYVGSVEVKEDKLYIGSCGESINVWDYNSLEFIGIYTTGKERTNWNEKECITGIYLIGEKLLGVGEKTVFVWNLENRKLTGSYPKMLTNSTVLFYKNYVVEYKNDKFVLRNLEDGKAVRSVKTEKPVEDMIVTSEKIFSTHSGDLLVLALRHNKGLLFYDFNTLKLLKKIDTNGQALSAYKNAVLATDDRSLYKYDIAYKDTEHYEKFLGKIRADNLVLSDGIYYQLLKRFQDYPEVMASAGVFSNFLKSKDLKLQHSFKYARIGERIVSDPGGAPDSGHKENVYGYKVLYEMYNDASDYYFVNLASEWSGEYGKTSSYEETGAIPTDSAKKGFTEQSFFIPPEGKYKGQFEVGEKEPLNFLIYPKRVESVSKGYYEGFMKAVSSDNEDVSLIDKYIGDSLVKSWHEMLKERKSRLTGKDKDSFWFFNK
ncbi:MAG: hypothetical protein BWK80_01785 [Desulfobacteraceae bacterium IS3]|nr:MAG: hypothetical protein BWK80_01785 [Desulfobacteraceae bacterium IS3]